MPLPATSRLRGVDSLAASKGYARDDRIAEPGEVIALFQNDDGMGERPEPMVTAAAYLLLAHDAAGLPGGDGRHPACSQPSKYLVDRRGRAN